MSRTKAAKPKLNIINPDTIQQQVLSCVNDQIVLLGYDLNNPKDRKSISHNEVNYILRRVYDNIFKPSTGLMNNQKSIIDYDDIDQIQAVVNVYIDICSRFNKSLGLMSFSFMSGIDITTLLRWINNPELNLERSKAIQKIQEVHKALQIGLLNDSPVGALAVANNDTETGLNWSEKQAAAAAANTIYILPSERLQTLGVKGSTAALQPPAE
jgi:hypothetical protein